MTTSRSTRDRAAVASFGSRCCHGVRRERGHERRARVPADVVLLDIGLRGPNDGVTVAEWLRDEPSFDHTLLVALTGRCDGEHDDRIATAGFDYHLIKPVSFDELEAIIETAPERHVDGPKGNSIAG